MNTIRVGQKQIEPGALLAELVAAAPDLAAFLAGCGTRERTGAEFRIERRSIRVDDWSLGGSWVTVYLDLAPDTFLDFTLEEDGAQPVALVYSGHDAERAYALDDAGHEGTTLGDALGRDVALPPFLAAHADLRVVGCEYTPFDGDVHQTSLTLAEPGSGTVLGAVDGGPAAIDQVSAQAAALASIMAGRGR